VRNAGLEARAAADAAKEAVVAANATREEVKEAVAAVPSAKAAPAPGWDEWGTGGIGGRLPGIRPSPFSSLASPSTRPRTEFTG
jgi:hypothetical protein